jgi:Methyltransferase domain
VGTAVNRHQFLKGMHQSLAPRNYLEIGVSFGRSLTLSRTRTIGIDPDFHINVDLECDLQLIKATSDEFFDRPQPIAWFDEGVIDFGFIDGMHVFEFALRDFINVERLSSPHSVVVLDDMLPRSVAEAARKRETLVWAGDVFKVALVLERYRPDLIVVPVDTEPTGVVVVAGLDPTSTVLHDHYHDIVAEFATDDPQVVPVEILERRHAAKPGKVLAAPIWAELARIRDRRRGGAASGLDRLRELRGTAKYVATPPVSKPWPTPKQRREQQRRERRQQRKAARRS